MVAGEVGQGSSHHSWNHIGAAQIYKHKVQAWNNKFLLVCVF